MRARRNTRRIHAIAQMARPVVCRCYARHGLMSALGRLRTIAREPCLDFRIEKAASTGKRQNVCFRRSGVGLASHALRSTFVKRSSKLFLKEDELASLGSVAAESAYLESIVDDGIKDISRLSDAQFEIFTGKTMLGTKLDMLSSLGELRIKSQKRKKRFREIISRLKHLNNERSQAIHGLWEPVYDQPEGMTWHKWFFSDPSKWPVRLGAKVRNSRTKELGPLSTKRLDNLAEDLWKETGALYGFLTDVLNTKKKARSKVARALVKRRSKPVP
jgi:hypothetical protein